MNSTSHKSALFVGSAINKSLPFFKQESTTSAPQLPSASTLPNLLQPVDNSMEFRYVTPTESPPSSTSSSPAEALHDADKTRGYLQLLHARPAGSGTAVECNTQASNDA